MWCQRPRGPPSPVPRWWQAGGTAPCCVVLAGAVWIECCLCVSLHMVPGVSLGLLLGLLLGLAVSELLPRAVAAVSSPSTSPGGFALQR